ARRAERHEVRHARPQARQEVREARRGGGRADVRDHRHGRLGGGGQGRQLLQRARPRDDPALRRGRAREGRLRPARPAARTHRLPHPGQALRGVPPRAARRARARPRVAPQEEPGAPAPDRLGRHQGGQPRRGLPRRARARARPAAEDVRAAPVHDHDDPQPRRAAHDAPRARDRRARRRPGGARLEVRDVGEHPQGRPGRVVLGVEELLRRGHPHGHAQADRRGRPDPGPRDVPVSMTARPARLPFGTRFWLVVTVLFLAASWFGITTASAVGSLGPHRALYEVTSTPTGVVDLGPLGTLEVDSPLPLRLGVRVTVQEIPAESTAVGAPASLERLSGDLDRYVQFFTSPVTFLQDAALDLVRSAFVRSMVALAVLGAVVGGIYALVGAARRRELAAAAARRRRPVLAGALALTVLGVGFLVNPPLDLVTPGSRPASAIFEGTPLEGARITGRLAGLVDTYGAMALDAYRENEELYAGAEEALRMAWQQREEQSEGWQDLLLVSGRFTPLQRAILEEPDSLVTAVVVSDLHCNVGMAPVIQAAVELSGAEVVLDLGDTSVNGTQVER